MDLEPFLMLNPRKVWYFVDLTAFRWSLSTETGPVVDISIVLSGLSTGTGVPVDRHVKCPQSQLPDYSSTG